MESTVSEDRMTFYYARHDHAASSDPSLIFRLVVGDNPRTLTVERLDADRKWVEDIALLPERFEFGVKEITAEEVVAAGGKV